MINLERTVDREIIKAITTDPRIWDAISEDGSPKREEYEPPVDGAVYVLVRADGEPRGLFVLVPHSAIRWEVHTLLLPELSPWRKLEAAARCREWVFANTPCESLYTEIPEFNSAAYGFAIAAGMKEFGREKRAFLKNNRLYDIAWLAIHRPAVTDAQR